MAERLPTHNIVVLGATITPFSRPGQGYSDPNREKTRQTVNSWIRRNGGVYDAMLDFDRILADLANPAQLKEEYNMGNYLHPNVAGSQALADEIPLGVFDLRL
jgi:lysophospholipase L1-like esterase